jgi:hypothetical protein
MNKAKAKKAIVQEFGFAMDRINVIDAAENSFGTFDYIYFEVCFIEYTMRFDYIKQDYVLCVHNHNRIEK